MYYKIINQDSEVYQKLHKMRSDELLWAKENEQAIREKTGLDWDAYYGHAGQQNFGRMTEYRGFQFKETEKVDPEIWKRQKDKEEVFIPNTRTRKGREMNEFLMNGLKRNHFKKPLEILGLEVTGRFTFPYVELVGDDIVVYVDDNMEPADENLIEITRKEFQALWAKRDCTIAKT